MGARDSSLRHPVGGKQLALWSEGTAVVGGLRAGWAAEATHLARLGSVLSGSLKSGFQNWLSTCLIQNCPTILEIFFVLSEDKIEKITDR